MSEETIPANKPPLTAKLPPRFKKSCSYFWICDCSESMGLKNRTNNLVKMDEINKAIPQAIEEIRKFSKDPKQKAHQITMRTIRFSDTAEWMDKDNIPVDQYEWKNLTADGITSLGAALSKVAQALKSVEDGGTIPKVAYPPVLVLITDGYPTDEWNKGFEALMDQFWGENAIRIAIALEGADEDILRAFIGDVENAEKLLVRITDADLPKLATNIKLVTTTYGIPGEKKKPEPVVEPAPVPAPEPVQEPVTPEQVPGDTAPVLPEGPVPAPESKPVQDGASTPEGSPESSTDMPAPPEKKSPEPKKPEDSPIVQEEIIF